MASQIGCLTTLDDPEYVETWIRCFESLARMKKLRDRQNEGEQITDVFLATAGCEAIQKVSTIAYPQKSRRADFQKTWWGNKKEYQTKEKVYHHGKNKVSWKKTAYRRVYCTIRTPIERKSKILQIWKSLHRWNDHRRWIDHATLDRRYARPGFET